MTTASRDVAIVPESHELLLLHLCRSQDELEAALAARLAALLPARTFAVALHTNSDLPPEVRCTHGTDARLQTGESLDAAAVAGWSEYHVLFRNHTLGRLFVDSPVERTEERRVRDLLEHFGTALANLTIGAETRAASAHYCAILQALEEGIVLFQESDRDAVLARLLALAMAMVHAPAGALFVLDRAGDTASPLRLAQVNSMPESLIAALRAVDGSEWPRSFLQREAFHSDRAANPPLGGLDPDSVPPIVSSVLALPLRYQGVDTGLCVLFNVAGHSASLREVLERLTTFGRLGAAVVHRLHLEAQNAHQRSIQRELQIAAAIQERLLPRSAPVVDRLEFAWHSLSANNIGGDYLDLVSTDLGDLCAIIADASGHGINSALLMSSFRSTYRAEAPWLQPGDLCRHLNGEVCNEVGVTGMFITAAALTIERSTLRMTVSSAGHNPLLLYRAETDSVQAIEAHGPPLGFDGNSEFTYETVQLQQGDVLLLYTDGIPEATNQDLDMFGEDRLRDILRANSKGTAEDLLRAVLAELAAYTGRHRYDDDVSLSVVRVVPATAAGT